MIMNKKMNRILTCFFLLAACLSENIYAQNPDRKQPINIEADTVTVDDRNKVHIFEGSAVLTQGSLVIKGDRLVVTQGADGFQTGVATAVKPKLATFRQKKTGTTNEYIDGEAERIEYDGRTEKAKLFERAKVVSGKDVVRGPYIEYDSMTENYRVEGSSTVSKQPGRVHVLISPKEEDGAN